MRGAARTAVVPLLVTLGMLAADALPAHAAGDAADLWERSLRSGRTVPHTGEVVCMTWSRQGPRVATFAVSSSGTGMVVQPDAADLVALQGKVPVHTAGGVTGKYHLEVAGSGVLLGRDTTRVEIRRRSGGELRERVWVDDATGLALRRERYDGDELLSLIAYERLELESPPRMRAIPAPPPETAASATTLDLPDTLPGGYTLTGVPAPAGPDGEALRVVYDDGLYRVSVFARPGRPDWDALPSGAEPAEGITGAFEWPGALPRRIVWEAGATTWTLIGDAPPTELHALARALPQPAPPSLADRLGTGFARLWYAVSPFS